MFFCFILEKSDKILEKTPLYIYIIKVLRE